MFKYAKKNLKTLKMYRTPIFHNIYYLLSLFLCNSVKKIQDTLNPFELYNIFIQQGNVIMFKKIYVFKIKYKLYKNFYLKGAIYYIFYVNMVFLLFF